LRHYRLDRAHACSFVPCRYVADRTPRAKAPHPLVAPMRQGVAAASTLSRTAGEGASGRSTEAGEGLSAADTLTRLATLATLSRGAGEGPNCRSAVALLL